MQNIEVLSFLVDENMIYDYEEFMKIQSSIKIKEFQNFSYNQYEEYLNEVLQLEKKLSKIKNNLKINKNNIIKDLKNEKINIIINFIIKIITLGKIDKNKNINNKIYNVKRKWIEIKKIKLEIKYLTQILTEKISNFKKQEQQNEKMNSKFKDRLNLRKNETMMNKFKKFINWIVLDEKPKQRLLEQKEIKPVVIYETTLEETKNQGLQKHVEKTQSNVVELKDKLGLLINTENINNHNPEDTKPPLPKLAKTEHKEETKDEDLQKHVEKTQNNVEELKGQLVKFKNINKFKDTKLASVKLGKNKYEKETKKQDFGVKSASEAVNNVEVINSTDLPISQPLTPLVNLS